ncbi:MAG TPA: potassium channel protein [Clostridiaceae bacterium]|nr:potassium channel protein [Clostridiaceae bacterium]
MDKRKKILGMVALFLLLIIIGTVGYMLLLEVTLVDALYMTVITISTVGFEEVAHMTPEAKLFSIGLIFVSVGTVGYLVSNIVSYFVEGDIKEGWRRRVMDTAISKLKGHFILCGSGETGLYIISQFQKQGVPFVVIDNDELVIEELKERGVLFIVGDATHEEVLEKAGINRAKGLIASLSKDSENVFVVLTARQMNEKLYIVSRAIEPSAHKKLKKAGANNTVSPNEIGGRRMAALMMRPSVISFLDAITHAGEVVLDLEDVEIHKESTLCGSLLREAGIPEKTGLIILAMRKSEKEELIFNPSSSVMLEPGDTMIVLGKEDQVTKLRVLAKDNGEREFF